MHSIVVIGPGAVGGSIAAHLTTVHGASVCVAARTPFFELVVDSPEGVLRSTPLVLTDPTRAGHARWVLVATKTYDAETAAAWMSELVGPETTVAILQNGVEHVDRFDGFVPSAQLLPIVVDLPSHRTAPGRIVQRGVARLTAPSTESGTQFAALFAGTQVRIELTNDIVTAAWSKLAINAPGAITAATLVPRLDLDQPSTGRLVRQVVEETIMVGRAEGAAFPHGFIDDVMLRLAKPGSGHPNSLHADRLAGRPMEVEARNGAIVRFGARHGIPTPANAFLVDLLSVSAGGA